jgi:hypothetical protein
VVPNIVCYNTLLKAFARSSDGGALQSAMKLLGRMGADLDIKPDSISDRYIFGIVKLQKASSDAIKHVNHGPTNLDWTVSILMIST